MKSSRVFLVSGLVLFALIYLMSRGDNRGESIGTLRIFCAANMRKSVEELAKEYYKRYKVTIEADYDGSGTLLARLQLAESTQISISPPMISTFSRLGRKGLSLKACPLPT